MNKFGSLIQSKREEREMLLRHLSEELHIDTAVLSKIERREETAKQKHIKFLAKLFKLDYNKLFSLWLTNQALQVLYITEEEIKTIKN